MKKLSIVAVIAVAASSSFAAASCCSTEEVGQRKSVSASVADAGIVTDDGIVTREQIDEAIATLQRIKARIPPGQGGISVREIMVMQMEEIKKSPEYAKMPKDEKTRLDAAIETARRPPAATTRKDGARKPTARVPTQDTVEISDGTRAFVMPKHLARPVSARKRRK